MNAILRRDFSTLAVSTNAVGGKRIDANVTRVGVLTYHMADGTVRRELRHPDEVFAPASMASLAGACLTDDHPDGMVTPENYKALTIGHVDAPTIDGNYLRTGVHINDATAIRKQESGELVECSCGYWAKFDAEPGEYNGEPYDGVQREIRYNHVALGPLGWGRAGSAVRLRTDGKSSTLGESFLTPRHDGGEVEATPMAQIVFDGLSYEKGSDAHIDAVASAGKRAEARATKAEGDLVIANTALAAATASAVSEKSRADAAELASKPETIAEAVAYRTRLIDGVRRGRGKVKGDPTFMADKKDQGASTDDLIVRVLKKLLPGYNAEGKSAEVLAEMVDFALGQAEPGVTEPPDGEAPADGVNEGDLGAESADDPPEDEPPAQDSLHAARVPRQAARSDGADGRPFTIDQLERDLRASGARRGM